MPMKPALLILMLITIHDKVNCSNILVVTMPQGRSHGGSMLPLLAELVRQGHNVTIYMEQYGEAVNFGRGINQWYINITNHPSPHANDTFWKSIWHKNFDPTSLGLPFYYSSISCDYVLNEYKDDFLRISQYPWDLVLTDSLFAVCGYGLALLTKAKHVIMHTTSVEAAQGLAKGYARQYITSPPFCMPAENVRYNVKNFLDRLYLAYEWAVIWYVVAVAGNSYMQRALAPVVPKFDYMTFNKLSSLSLTDMPTQLYLPETRTNELFSYGAYCEPSGHLSGELVKFVTDHRSHGTIFLAFGTILDWTTAPKDQRNAFVEVLNQLSDYRIIWACRNCPPMKTKSHVKLLSWAPQRELLNHPLTKLFITHGGLKSVKEAICAKMPTLFMPVFGEQVRNAWLAKHHGFGQVINRFNVTVDHLLYLVRDLLTNQSYKKRAEKIRRYFEDAPLSPLQEGAFYIKRLLKYNGRMPEYFYTRSTNMGYIRYLNLDLILLIPAVIYSLLLIR